MRRKAHKSFREKIRFYLIDSETLLGKSIDIFIVFLNILICLIFVIETYPISEATRRFLWNLEVITIIFFIMEYMARLYGARNRVSHTANIYSIIDLVAILPTILLILFPAFPLHIEFIKTIRAFRVLRFLRFIADPQFFFGKISISFLKVVRLVLTILIIFFISSGFFWYTESSVNDDIKTFGDAFYFTVVTLTTVGFGDIAPVSSGGRTVTILMIISGIILIPWQVGLIAKEWMRFSDKRLVVCKKCGLKYHEKDAIHCKACGCLIYQESEGD